MDKLTRDVQLEILQMAYPDVQVGYFWKEIKTNQDYASWKGEKIFATPDELLEDFLNHAQKKEILLYGKVSSEIISIKREIMDAIETCTDSLSVCDMIKKLLSDYNETCYWEIDINFISIFSKKNITKRENRYN